MTTEVKPCLLASGTVGEGDMIVGNIVEEMDFFLLQKQARRDGVDRGIPPTFIEKASILIERFEEVGIRLGA